MPIGGVYITSGGIVLLLVAAALVFVLISRRP